MKFALIDSDSLVANVIVADQEFAESIKNDWSAVINADDFSRVQIGMRWTGSDFEDVLPDPDVLAAAIRAERNRRLADCDWTRLTDSPFDADQKFAWALYREALRNITVQSGFPREIIWPAKPTN